MYSINQGPKPPLNLDGDLGETSDDGSTKPGYTLAGFCRGVAGLRRTRSLPFAFCDLHRSP